MIRTATALLALGVVIPWPWPASAEPLKQLGKPEGQVNNPLAGPMGSGPRGGPGGRGR